MTDWDASPSFPDLAGLDTASPLSPPAAEAPSLRLGAVPVARGLHEALLRRTAEDPVVLDASEVERLSGPVLQVILAAIIEASGRGAQVVVRDPSFAFTLTFEAYGLGGDNEPFTVEYS